MLAQEDLRMRRGILGPQGAGCNCAHRFALLYKDTMGPALGVLSNESERFGGFGCTHRCLQAFDESELSAPIRGLSRFVAVIDWPL